ncbi:hypothetical protein [Leucobacter chinensis]|uniref:hypothetical protein n=1 Tax=Leucobacter chinensis TaxID=2851010 RepID=UPI001C237F7C|nr:hypothetical protein [Leucobacter chinensis]
MQSEQSDPQPTHGSEETTPNEPLTTDSEATSKGNRDAAKYRRRLREVEEERDTLTAQLDELRKLEVERSIEQLGIKPAAVWALETTLPDLVNEEGLPDTEKITAAVTQAKLAFGIPEKPKAATDGSGGNRGSDIEAEPSAASQWTGAFEPQKEW